MGTKSGRNGCTIFIVGAKRLRRNFDRPVRSVECARHGPGIALRPCPAVGILAQQNAQTCLCDAQGKRVKKHSVLLFRFEKKRIEPSFFEHFGCGRKTRNLKSSDPPVKMPLIRGVN